MEPLKNKVDMIMTDAEVIRIQREAIAKYCKNDRQLALKVIKELGFEMRQWVEARRTKEVLAEDLCEVIRSSAECWPED